MQAADLRLGLLQQGNRSLRTDIGSDQIKLQAAAQVLQVNFLQMLLIENAVSAPSLAVPSYCFCTE